MRKTLTIPRPDPLELGRLVKSWLRLLRYHETGQSSGTDSEPITRAGGNDSGIASPFTVSLERSWTSWRLL